jgi:hypothetical protein
MNDEPDPIQDTPGDNGQFGATFAIGNIVLKPLSHGHRNAFFRITGHLDLRGDETNIALLYVLTRDKKELHLLRTREQYLDFLMLATEWAEAFKIKEITDVANAVWKDYEQAAGLEPEPQGTESGNG